MKPEPVTRPLSLKRYVKLRRSLRRYQEHRGRRVATRGLQGMWAQVDGRAAHVVGRLLEPPRQPSRGRVSRPRLVARRQQHGKEQEGETAHDGGQDDQGAGRADGPPKAL
jgi:hypothetical protein